MISNSRIIIEYYSVNSKYENDSFETDDHYNNELDLVTGRSNRNSPNQDLIMFCVDRLKPRPKIASLQCLSSVCYQESRRLKSINQR
jgi:hypothetical protein